ncbi:ATPase PAAT isoform X2 [Anser cygnoides]|uniref:ATPase PAAT isoform X2 n=1 Tax=Anser cygnoides TaxID=8845 RepID=UPI0034D344F0
MRAAAAILGRPPPSAPVPAGSVAAGRWRAAAGRPLRTPAAPGSLPAWRRGARGPARRRAGWPGCCACGEAGRRSRAALPPAAARLWWRSGGRAAGARRAACCSWSAGRPAPRRWPPSACETEKVTLYKKYLKLECPAASCRIKLLSIGEKQRVLISKIIVEVKTVSAKLATDFPSLGSSIDLDRVQTIMESMGSKLSPGAQQLMDMVRYQQKNSGDKLSWIFGKNSDFGDETPVDGLHSATIQMSQDQSASAPLSVKNPLTSETVCEDSKINLDQNTQVPERENTSDSGGLTTQQNTADFRNDLKVMGSLLMQEQTNQNVASPQVLLPFLQNICSQVNHLRLKDGDRHLSKNTVTKEEGIQAVGLEQQPICSYLEKIISKNMDLMEKKLMDYIDRQIQALQTHIDNKMVLLMDLVQNSKQNKISQAHYDSSEGFSNGER